MDIRLLWTEGEAKSATMVKKAFECNTCGLYFDVYDDGSDLPRALRIIREKKKP